MNLYTFEVYVFKISALKLQKMTKLLIPKHATLISKHPVFGSVKLPLFAENIYCATDAGWSMVLKVIYINKVTVRLFVPPFSLQNRL